MHVNCNIDFTFPSCLFTGNRYRLCKICCCQLLLFGHRFHSSEEEKLSVIFDLFFRYFGLVSPKATNFENIQLRKYTFKSRELHDSFEFTIEFSKGKIKVTVSMKGKMCFITLATYSLYSFFLSVERVFQ